MEIVIIIVACTLWYIGYKMGKASGYRNGYSAAREELANRLLGKEND